VERSGSQSISLGPAELSTGTTGIALIRDDDYFNAVAVGIGCMGIIYAVVLRVMDGYELKETRKFSVWSKVRKDLEEGKVLQSNRHYELLINPYSYNKKDHKCLVTEISTMTARHFAFDVVTANGFM
jgi:hypothetical protein